jgi:4-hydroxy-tetrahydrodipicolinate reductase
MKRGTNMTRVIMNGCNGKMGQCITGICKEDAGIEIVAGIDVYQGIENDYPVFASISECDVEADVIIDFSFHGLIKEITDYAISTKTPLIVATTGHTDEEKEIIKAASKETAVFYSGNMSVGIATLCDVVKKVVSVFPDADVEIIETHHNRKLDAPSGTAKMLFNSVKEAREEAYANYGRSGNCKREKNEVGINAIRVGNIVGIHEVIIGTDFEQITLKHEAYDRAMFAQGAIKAAQYLVGKGAGLYSMKDLLTDK